MNVSQLMTKNVVTVRTDTSLKDVAALLATHGISGLPVVRDGEVLGVVSEADILYKERGPVRPADGLLGKLRARRGDVAALKLEARTAGEAMTSPAVTISPRRRVAEAARLMIEKAVNRLPVVDNGELVGIVTRADLVRAFNRPDEEIEREIREDVVVRTFWMAPHDVTIEVADGIVTPVRRGRHQDARRAAAAVRARRAGRRLGGRRAHVARRRHEAGARPGGLAGRGHGQDRRRSRRLGRRPVARSTGPPPRRGSDRRPCASSTPTRARPRSPRRAPRPTAPAPRRS